MLYGVSAMGTRLSFYEYTKATGNVLSPPFIASIINDVAPMERWNYELLETAGEDKLRAVIAEVKAMTNNIKELCLAPQAS
ncbi:hypothetical protein AX17_001560 [Amanita inopinata Kibby_2008]|nr:hypothetical protein AX17_001560 [Amanita inopinata Kibby_2008]